MQQELAAEKLLKDSDGVLEAATAFGKTVVCSYLIAERKVNTLILLQSKDLLSQWVDELNKFLDIREEPPEYETKTGRKKKRDSAIGILHGSKNTLTGIVDIAMVGSMYSKGKFQNLKHAYGMVIVDECHHAASHTYMEVLQKINAKYVYGVSATPKRGDHLDKIIYMMLGPLRHRFTALERAEEQGIGHYFVPRYTRVIDTEDSRNDINKAYSLISISKVRNEMIANDVKQSISQNQTPVILTRYKEHAKILYDMLKDEADHVFLLYGDNSDKENAEIRIRLKKVPRTESLILIATGQKIGEGFDFPRLDVLILAAPVSFEGRLEQYIGRLNRDYEGKEAVYVYDYIDTHMRKFNKMYGKRLRTYKKTGFSVWTGDLQEKQVVHAIFDSGNYTEKFEQDLVEEEKSIVISSPNIRQEKIDRLLVLVKERQENGVSVTVITTDPEKIIYGNADMCYELIREMQNVAINVVTKEALYDSVRGIWRASLERVKTVEYVFGVYNSLIVAVYKPTTWYVCKEALKELSENGLLIRKSVGFSKPKHLYVLLPDEESYIRGENETDENKAAIKSESQLSDSRDDDCMKVAKEASSKVIEKENINNNNRVIGGKGKRKKEYSKEVDYSCEEGESL